MKLSFESGPGDVPTGDILQYYGKADIPACFGILAMTSITNRAKSRFSQKVSSSTV
jgi:hypothetical protein